MSHPFDAAIEWLRKGYKDNPTAPDFQASMIIVERFLEAAERVDKQEALDSFDQMQENCRRNMDLSLESCQGCLGQSFCPKIRVLLEALPETEKESKTNCRLCKYDYCYNDGWPGCSKRNLNWEFNLPPENCADWEPKEPK